MQVEPGTDLLASSVGSSPSSLPVPPLHFLVTWLNPYSFAIWAYAVDVDCGPLSDITISGTPCLAKMLFAVVPENFEPRVIVNNQEVCPISQFEQIGWKGRSGSGEEQSGSAP